VLSAKQEVIRNEGRAGEIRGGTSGATLAENCSKIWLGRIGIVPKSYLSSVPK
jgi:hypothetical protein